MINISSCSSHSSSAGITNVFPQRLSELENVLAHRRLDDTTQPSNQDNSNQQDVNSHGNSQEFPPVNHAVSDQTGSADPNRHGSGRASHEHVQADPIDPAIENSLLANSIGLLQLEPQNQTGSEVVPDNLFESGQIGWVEGTRSLEAISAIKKESFTETSAVNSTIFLQSYCKNHPEEKNLVCQECKMRICSQCQYSNHRGHTIEHVKQKIIELGTIVEKSEKYGEFAEKFIQEVEGNLNQEEQKEEEKSLEARENIVKRDIDNFKAVFREALEKENSLKIETRTRISTLQQSEICQDFLNALFDKVKPSTPEKYSQTLERWNLAFKKINSQDWRNDSNSFLFFTKGSHNELCISLSAPSKDLIVDNEGFYQFEEVKEVTLNIVGHSQPRQDAIIYAITGLAISYMLSRLREMSYCRVEFEHCPESYEIILDMIRNCFTGKEEVQVDWVAKNPNKAYINNDEPVIQVKIINKAINSYKLDFRFVKIADQSLAQILGAQVQTLQDLSINLSQTQISDKSIQEFAKMILPSMKLLKSIELDLSHTAIIDQSFEMMPVIHIESLREVRLKLLGTRITDKSIEVLANKMLPSMKFLHSLVLNLSDTAVTDQSITYLLALDLHALKHLSLNFARTGISDRDLQKFAERMPLSMPSLEQLELDLAYTAVADESVISFLSLALSELKQLRLNISETKVSELNIQAFLQETSSKNLLYFEPNPFKSLIQQHIDQLKPKALEEENADDKGIRGQDISSKSLAYFELNPVKSLTQQNFNYLKLETLENKTTGDKDMRKSISDETPSLKNLEYFELLLSESRVGFASIPYFATQMLHSAKNLEHFEVNLANSLIPDRILTHILSLSFKSIKHFKLDLSGIKLGDTCLRNFAKGMLSSMKLSVRHFELNLTYASVTDDSIAQILTVPLDSAEVFNLNLFGTDIGDKSIQSFTEGMLPSMGSLQNFVLNLTGTTVTNESVALMLSIPLENLIDFELNLGFTQISDTSIAQLVERMLPSMKKLEHFVLNLFKTLVTDESANQLVTMPKESLKVLGINLSRTAVSRSLLQTLAKYSYQYQNL